MPTPLTICFEPSCCLLNGVPVGPNNTVADISGILSEAPRFAPPTGNEAPDAFALFDESGVSVVFDQISTRVSVIRINLSGKDLPYLAKRHWTGEIIVTKAGNEKRGREALSSLEFSRVPFVGLVALPSKNYAVWLGLVDEKPKYLSVEWSVEKIKSLLGSVQSH